MICGLPDDVVLCRIIPFIGDRGDLNRLSAVSAEFRRSVSLWILIPTTRWHDTMVVKAPTTVGWTSPVGGVRFIVNANRIPVDLFVGCRGFHPDELRSIEVISNVQTTPTTLEAVWSVVRAAAPTLESLDIRGPKFRRGSDAPFEVTSAALADAIGYAKALRSVRLDLVVRSCIVNAIVQISATKPMDCCRLMVPVDDFVETARNGRAAPRARCVQMYITPVDDMSDIIQNPATVDALTAFWCGLVRDPVVECIVLTLCSNWVDIIPLFDATVPPNAGRRRIRIDVIEFYPTLPVRFRRLTPIVLGVHRLDVVIFAINLSMVDLGTRISDCLGWIASMDTDVRPRSVRLFVAVDPVRLPYQALNSVIFDGSRSLPTNTVVCVVSLSALPIPDLKDGPIGTSLRKCGYHTDAQPMEPQAFLPRRCEL
jgi:hypothetical protein